jgi:hypothetical protein
MKKSTVLAECTVKHARCENHWHARSLFTVSRNTRDENRWFCALDNDGDSALKATNYSRGIYNQLKLSR